MAQIAHIAIFKGDFLKRSLYTPAVQPGKFQTDGFFYLLKAAIPNDNIFRRLSDFRAEIAVIGKDGKLLMACAGIMLDAHQLFLVRKTCAAAEIVLVGYTVFHQKIIAADAKGHKGAVQFAVPNDDVVVVKACHSIIRRIDIAVLNENVITGTDIDSVLAAVNGNISNGDVLALENGVAPVAAV